MEDDGGIHIAYLLLVLLVAASFSLHPVYTHMTEPSPFEGNHEITVEGSSVTADQVPESATVLTREHLTKHEFEKMLDKESFSTVVVAESGSEKARIVSNADYVKVDGYYPVSVTEQGIFRYVYFLGILGLVIGVILAVAVHDTRHRLLKRTGSNRLQ